MSPNESSSPAGAFVATIAFVATTDAAASLAFYRDVLGLTLVADEPFAIVFDAYGTMLRIQKAPGHVALPHTALGWQVRGIDAIVDALVAKGVTMKRYEGMGQDPQGIWTSPGGARIAWFEDPDHNVLSLTQW